jgi:predicted TIM-barrel fold metal-dependent hydrolase
MRITDAQIHLVTPNTPDRPWAFPMNDLHGRTEFGAETILGEMDRAGVDRVVLVPPTVEGERNDTCLAAAAAHPDRFAVIGRVNVADPAVEALLPNWLDQPGMLGLRGSFVRGESAGWLDDGSADWFFTAAERYRIPLYMHVPNLLPKVAAIADQHPELRLAIDHLGMTGSVRETEIDPTIDELIKLASRPNVAVKASSLPSIARDAYPYRSMHDRIHRVLDAFGPRRVFWGSDLTRLPCSYREGVTLFTEELDFLAGDDLEWVMGRGVETWLGWA